MFDEGMVLPSCDGSARVGGKLCGKYFTSVVLLASVPSVVKMRCWWLITQIGPHQATNEAVVLVLSK